MARVFVAQSDAPRRCALRAANAGMGVADRLLEGMHLVSYVSRFGLQPLEHDGDGMKVNMKIIYGMIILLPLCACDEQGPLERAGEEVDEAVDDVRNGRETPENRVDDAVDDVREGVDDARRELDE
jgi:hypothetical protein